MRQVVREGEWNEAICYMSDKHYGSEIVAQKGRDCWFVSYNTAKKVLTIITIAGTGEGAKVVADTIAYKCSEALNKDNPLAYLRKHYSHWFDTEIKEEGELPFK